MIRHKLSGRKIGGEYRNILPDVCSERLTKHSQQMKMHSADEMTEAASSNINSVVIPARFMFKRLKWICAWMLSVYPLGAAMPVVILAREGASLSLLILIILIAIVGIAGSNAVLLNSDVIVDDNGISKSLFGKTWQTIRWDNVRVIRAFPIMDPSAHKMIRGFNIYPSIRSQFSVMPSNKMAFLEQAENISNLIELVNHYASKYGIKIESTVNGVKTSVYRL